MDAAAFLNGTRTQEEINAWRGTPDETLARIRLKYNLTDDVFPEVEIFRLANQYFYGHTDLDARTAAESDYAGFVAGGRTKLPYYVLRAGDLDVDYKHMHAF